jgi:hypothetical protein
MNHSANSFCYVQSTAASRYQPVRTPATSVEAEKPAPPPFIQQSISRPADASATYAPRAARWDYLEQAPQPEPRRSGGGGGGGGFGLAQSESAYVLCIVQVVASEAHFTSDESFDPVPEIRLRLRDLGSVTVKRLTDLIHVSINYPPRHRGVVRCYTAENRPWVIKTPGPKGGAAKCVSMAPFDAPLSEFVNVEELMLPYESSNSEAVLHLRWVEDAQVPASAAASAVISAVPHEERRNEVPQPLVMSVRGPSVSSTSTAVSLGGYRVERDHTPISFVPDARSTPSHLLQQQWHNHVPFTLAAPSSATHSQYHSRTPSETIPVLRVPSRSASATSTPNMSPVRRTPGATTPAAAERQGPVVPTSRTAADTRSDEADAYHIQPERLLTASEGVLRFGQHPLVAPAPSSSRGASPQRSADQHLLGQDVYTAPTTPINNVRPISLHHHARSASGIEDDAVFGADSAVAPSSRASSTIVIDGVSYTPTSSRTQQLADEIAALRNAIFSEDRQLTQAKGMLQQEFPEAARIDV